MYIEVIQDAFQTVEGDRVIRRACRKQFAVVVQLGVVNRPAVASLDYLGRIRSCSKYSEPRTHWVEKGEKTHPKTVSNECTPNFKLGIQYCNRKKEKLERTQ